jgi:hypothetical protein
MKNPTMHGATPGQAAPEDGEFHTIAARFALKGHALHRHTRADDGRVTYTASRWSQSRVFSHWGDVTAFLAQIGGRP